MGDLGKLSVHAAIGVVMGIAAIVWIKPDNAGGSALLIVFFTALAIIVGAVLKAIRGRG
jgi:hypothetical protein